MNRFRGSGPSLILLAGAVYLGCGGSTAGQADPCGSGCVDAERDVSPGDPATDPGEGGADMPAVDHPADPIETAPDLPAVDEFDGEWALPLECPLPIVVIEEGEEVCPPVVLHLHGDQSLAASGTIHSYSWTVVQPPDNQSALLPDAASGQPTHDLEVAGEYTYCLDVCDADFCSSDPQCKTTVCKKIVVTPCSAGIHCELTWTTPGDSDPYDTGPGVGSDMDLHFLHPSAAGPDLDDDGKPDGWFDVHYDVFWHNYSPDWESMNPNARDDPLLDRDDVDGAGPENVTLGAPVANRVYRVGVFYAADHGFGISTPRLKCHVYGQLVFDRDMEAMGVAMNACDLWEAATFAWPQGVVASVQNPDGSPKITPGYSNPAFPCDGATGAPPAVGTPP